MRPNDIKAIKEYRTKNECSLFTAKTWDDFNRVQEAVESASTITDLKPVIMFLAERLLRA